MNYGEKDKLRRDENYDSVKYYYDSVENYEKYECATSRTFFVLSIAHFCIDMKLTLEKDITPEIHVNKRYSK